MKLLTVAIVILFVAVAVVVIVSFLCLVFVRSRHVLNISSFFGLSIDIIHKIYLFNYLFIWIISIDEREKDDIVRTLCKRQNERTNTQRNETMQKLKTLDTAMLCDICLQLAYDPRKEAITVLDAALAELEIRTTAKEFCLFCESLYLAM